jgi:hypothetical protein
MHLRKVTYATKLVGDLCKDKFVCLINGDRLCDLVVRVPDYRSRGPGSIPSATRFSE